MEIPELLSDFTIGELSNSNTSSLNENICNLSSVKTSFQEMLYNRYYYLGKEAMPSSFQKFPYSTLSIACKYLDKEIPNYSISNEYVPIEICSLEQLCSDMTSNLSANKKIKHQFAWILNDFDLSVPSRYIDYVKQFDELLTRDGTELILYTNSNDDVSYRHFYGFDAKTIGNEPICVKYDVDRDWSNQTSVLYSKEDVGFHSYFMKDNISSLNKVDSASTRYTLTDIKKIGKHVLQIGDSAFSNQRNLSSVDFSDSNVSSLGDGCFTWSNLRTNTIKLNTKIREIPKSCFRCCTGMNDIDWIPETISSLGMLSFYQFERGKGLSSINIGKNILSVGRNCFGYNTAGDTTDRISVDVRNPIYCNMQYTDSDGTRKTDYNSIFKREGGVLISGKKELATPYDKFSSMSDCYSIDDSAFGVVHGLESVSLIFPPTISSLIGTIVADCTIGCLDMTKLPHPPKIQKAEFFSFRNAAIPCLYTTVKVPKELSSEYLEDTNWELLSKYAFNRTTQDPKQTYDLTATLPDGYERRLKFV